MIRHLCVCISADVVPASSWDAMCTTSLLTTLDVLVNSSNVNLLSLEDRLGPKRQDLYKVIPVTVIYVGIFFTGIVGNVCTCIVIARNRYMHTTTNLCLFNLAVSDLLVLILGLPQETYSFWSAYPWIFGETFAWSGRWPLRRRPMPPS